MFNILRQTKFQAALERRLAAKQQLNPQPNPIFRLPIYSTTSIPPNPTQP
ncbi:hypothetical protein [Kingella oralis]